MASASDYAENKILELLVGKTGFATPTVYVALCTTTPTDASIGSTLVEATYTGYARKDTTGLWGSAASGSITNSSAITFVACSGGSSTITGFALVDSGTTGAGNVLAWGTCSLSVSSGITPQFAISALTITCD